MTIEAGERDLILPTALIRKSVLITQVKATVSQVFFNFQVWESIFKVSLISLLMSNF
jgi:hypothetical protein